MDISCRPSHCGAGDEEVAAGYRVVLVRRGAFVKSVGRRQVIVDPRNGVLFEPGQPYRVSHLSTSGDDCTVLAFGDPALIGDAAAARRRRHGPLLLPVSASTGLRLHSLRRAIANGGAARLAVDELALEVLRSAMPLAIASVGWSTERPRRASEIVEEVKRMVAAAPGASLRLRVLAEAVGCSPFHLARRFRASTGESIHQYHLRMRVTIGLNMLADGQRDLSALAHTLGFTSHSHFTATFRRYLGHAPSELRATDVRRGVSRRARRSAQ